MRKIFTALLALLVLAMGLCGQALAAESPDPGRLGSITFVMEFNDEILEGGSLTLYRVGRIGPDLASFVLVEPLNQDSPSLDDLGAPELAEQLKELAVAYELEPITAAIENGQAVFADLETGLYVVTQRPGEEIPGYAAIDPFLISLPQRQDGVYVYDLTAAPKVPLMPEPTEPSEPSEPTEPTEPDEPDIPQTGQLNWPVPLMAVAGLVFFALGWSLFFGGKRKTV